MNCATSSTATKEMFLSASLSLNGLLASFLFIVLVVSWSLSGLVLSLMQISRISTSLFLEITVH